MSNTDINPRPVEFIGHQIADQITVDNIDDWAASLNGTIEEGILVFKIHNFTHRAIPGDWIVTFMPSGDVQVYTEKMFNRIAKLSD